MEKRKGGILETLRGTYQGVWNVVRFNWHYYAISFFILFGSVSISALLPKLQYFFYSFGFCGFILIFITLAVTHHIYDRSNLYELNWLNDWIDGSEKTILNVHAGFDETSHLLKNKFPNSELIVFDFYDPKLHTEVSIERARKVYPPFPGTKKVSTSYFPLEDGSLDCIFIILSAHEIRDDRERGIFFSELKRVLKPNGKIVVTEHLRDTANFLVYSIGFFHFFSKTSWLETFANAGLIQIGEKKITRFIRTFILQKNGITL
ncbi:class I SAM-dependent methyltransferase [Leptospira koniambonensis]|uniref:class I SAM-dependent methyltransferase n=1 Tax=Leptospira koniambonensis TaxID=2484950 RepID=UPI003EB96E06